MSPKPRAYRPTEPPEPARVNMTLDELHSMLERFKKLFEDSPLAKWIVLAGVGGLVELVHTLWLAARYMWKF